MNNLDYVQKKLNLIKNPEILSDINIIMNHLTIAEHHFLMAMEAKNESFFNDVIYRTNQAYEGILRLAYSMILKRSDKNKSNKEMEDYLLKENIINERTKNYLSLYRGDFRNRSNHDYKQDFTESDAYLAINNVNGFLYTLLNQLLVYDAYLMMEQKQEEIKIINKKLFTNDYSFLEYVINALLLFPDVYYMNPKGNDLEKGFYTIGELEAYLNRVNPSWEVQTCQFTTPEVDENGYRGEIEMADLIIKSKKEKIIISICIDHNFSFRENFISKMEKCCKIFEADYGLILQIDGRGKYRTTTEISEPYLIQRIHKERRDSNHE